MSYLQIAPQFFMLSTGDGFPSTEIFISDISGQSVFLGVSQIKEGTNKDTGVIQLFDEDKTQIS